MHHSWAKTAQPHPPPAALPVLVPVVAEIEQAPRQLHDKVDVDKCTLSEGHLHALACCCSYRLRAQAYMLSPSAPAEHEGKPFFEKLVAFLSSGAVVATVWEGPEVCAAFQMILVHLGAWQPMNGT